MATVRASTRAGTEALVDGVVASRPVECDRQPVAVTFDEDGRLDVWRGRTASPWTATTRTTLSSLQERVHRRLGGEPVVHRRVRRPTQVDGERGRGQRVLADVRQHEVEPRVVRSDDDVARLVWFGGSRPSGARTPMTTTGWSPGDHAGGSSVELDQHDRLADGRPSSSAAVNQLTVSSELPTRRGGVVAIGEPYRRPCDRLPA